jgi:tetratricopeptide (TPR) repeat protein
MKKMQWARKKNVLIIVALFLFANLPLYSQISAHRLQQADSLFNAKQFTQSLAHYQQILNKNEFTPAMLLKMAFVEEGLNHIGEALYYLNLYFLATNDESVLEKMDQLSEKYKLTGYDLDETEQAFSFYRKYTDYISFFLMALLLFLLSLAIYVRRRNHSPAPVLITLLIIATLFGIHINAGNPELKGIVAGDNTYLMAGPAGAAPVVAVIQGGHRFNIVGRKDVWVQVEWNGETAFIKENRVLPVQL